MRCLCNFFELHIKKATIFGCIFCFATYISCTMYQNTRKIAVITGDLVNSTELGHIKVEQAFARLEACANMQADWYGAPLHFTRHRGDGWQVVLTRPKMALRSALAFRATLRTKGSEFDSYMGIAEGDVVGDVGPDLNAETANVFTDSGRNLTSVRDILSWQKIKCSVDAIQAVSILADDITQGWTPTQAETVLQFMDPNKKHNKTEVSKTLGKSRQTVTKTLSSASFGAIHPVLILIEDQLND